MIGKLIWATVKPQTSQPSQQLVKLFKHLSSGQSHTTSLQSSIRSVHSEAKPSDAYAQRQHQGNVSKSRIISSHKRCAKESHSDIITRPHSSSLSCVTVKSLMTIQLVESRADLGSGQFHCLVIFTSSFSLMVWPPSMTWSLCCLWGGCFNSKFRCLWGLSCQKKVQGTQLPFLMNQQSMEAMFGAAVAY